MTTDHREPFTQRMFQGSNRSYGENRTAGGVRAAGEVLSHRARSFLAALPASLQEQMALHPYRTVGIALAVGLGTGFVIGSRIWRATLVSAASIAAVELGRSYLRHEADQGSSSHPGKPVNVSWS